MDENLYYYKIGWYEPFGESDNFILAHEKEFDSNQLSVMVQDVVDDVIKQYADTKQIERGDKPCRLGVCDLFSKKIISIRLQAKYGFVPCLVKAETYLQDGKLFSGEEITQNKFLFERYKDYTLPKCKECTIDKEYYPECIVPHKRWNDDDND